MGVRLRKAAIAGTALLAGLCIGFATRDTTPSGAAASSRPPASVVSASSPSTLLVADARNRRSVAVVAPSAQGTETPTGAPAPLRVARTRAPGEWDGMPAEYTSQACPSAELCGLALGCHKFRCGPCAADIDCAPGEVCVLQHCVLSAQVACRARSDCDGGDLCVLSGLSPGPRGNGDMRAYCLSSGGPSGETPVVAPTPGPQILPEIHPMKLLSTLRE